MRTALRTRRVALCLSVGFLSLAAGMALYRRWQFVEKHSKAHSCESRLHTLGIAIRMIVSEKGRYPLDFRELVDAMPDMDMSMFLCPSTRNPPGEPSNVDTWADYKYVEGHSDEDPSTDILAFCPLGNHSERKVNVLFFDVSVDSLDHGLFLRAMSRGPASRSSKGGRGVQASASGAEGVGQGAVDEQSAVGGTQLEGGHRDTSGEDAFPMPLI